MGGLVLAPGLFIFIRNEYNTSFSYSSANAPESQCLGLQGKTSTSKLIQRASSNDNKPRQLTREKKRQCSHEPSHPSLDGITPTPRWRVDVAGKERLISPILLDPPPCMIWPGYRRHYTEATISAFFRKVSSIKVSKSWLTHRGQIIGRAPLIAWAT